MRTSNIASDKKARPRCETCKHWWEREFHMGECRINAPTAVLSSELLNCTLFARFPSTHSIDGCSQHSDYSND